MKNKYIILLTSLLTFGCSQSFNVGDCVRQKQVFGCKKSDSKCQYFFPIGKIVQVNPTNYHIAYHSTFMPNNKGFDHSIFDKKDNNWFRVECPLDLKNYEE